MFCGVRLDIFTNLNIQYHYKLSKFFETVSSTVELGYNDHGYNELNLQKFWVPKV
jgi:hypothetical protein